MRLAAGGRVLLDSRPGDPPLPDDLQAAMAEWAALALHVRADGGPAERESLRARGRWLAARVAAVQGRTVTYVDPCDDTVLRVAPRRPAEPVPWSTGLTVSLFTAVWTALADVLLSRAFAEAFGALWVVANVVVSAGIAPSLYLLARLRFWRWIAYGGAAGLAAAWVVLLLDLLGAATS